MSRADELLERIKNDPYNEISAHKVPGGITIMLSHRITMDAAVEVFVANDDVLFFDREEDQETLEVLNHGGPWPGKEEDDGQQASGPQDA